jgi:polyferredoxin
MKKIAFQLKVSFILLILLVTIAIILLPLYFFNLHHVVIGTILGIAINSLYFFLDYHIDKNKNKLGIVLSIISMTLKFLIVGGLMVLFGYLEFKLNFKFANIFAFIGGYLSSLIIAIILFNFNRRKDDNIR